MIRKLLLKLAVVVVFGIVLSMGFVKNPARVSAAPEGLNIHVDDTADLPDTTPGDGHCRTANNTCTLRAAIMEANAHRGTDVIQLAANATYKLTRAGNDDTAYNGDLDITDTMDLIGNNATIDANSGVTHDRAFDFLPTKKQQSSELEHITIEGGSTTGFGGGILNGTTLFLNNVRVVSNHADGQGGGIANNGGVVIEDSTIEDNDCSCADAAHPGGGGIVNHGGLILFRSTLDNNKSHYDGGGLWNDGDNTVIVTSTFAFNVADQNGGAIYTHATALTILYSTIASNFADADNNDVGYAGGIYNAAGGNVTLGHTLLAKNGNVEGFLWTWDDCHGAIGSSGYNLIYANNLCVVSLSQNLIGFEPALDTFGDHGGPTKTYSLKANSWAIDNGNPDGCKTNSEPGLPTDQRMDQRIVDGSGDNVAICDIGAYEYLAGPYVDSCSSAKPPKPTIYSPANKAVLKRTQVWMSLGSDCTPTYKVKVHRDTKTGPIADQIKALGMPMYLTSKLDKGHTYWARVSACNAQGCTKSAWTEFTITP